MIRTRIIQAFTLVTAMMALAFGTAAPAVAGPASPAEDEPAFQAAQQLCSGSLIHSYDLFNGDITIEEYYSSADGGTNCALAIRNRYVGNPVWMDLTIMRCATGNPNNNCNADLADRDYGEFGYYAGPVKVDRTNGECVMLRLNFDHDYNHEHGPRHCG